MRPRGGTTSTLPMPGGIVLTPQQIKRWRLMNAWDQARVAYRFGVTTRTVRRWEKGDTYPPAWVCEDIARFFKVTIPTVKHTQYRRARGTP